MTIIMIIIPDDDQVLVSRLQNTQVGLPIPSSLRCLRLTLTGAEIFTNEKRVFRVLF